MGDMSAASVVIETDLLIAGAGPAGASLACFLSRSPYNLKGVMISNIASTSPEPRAHVTNSAALECLRDIELEQICLKTATSNAHMANVRWSHSMTGEEYGRIRSFGNDPARRGEYECASPCCHVDLPQTKLEPILCQRATLEGWQMRFSTSIVDFTRDTSTSPPTIVSTLHDSLLNTSLQVRSRYLFGADGARSQVMRTLDIPLVKEPGQGLAINILVRCDLSNYMKYRTGNLHWVFQPEKEYPPFAFTGVVRMVKPWDEWMFIFLPLPGVEWVEPSQEQYMKRVRDFIGKDDIPAEILDISKWKINEIVASSYSAEHQQIHCLGDAVHRHPPFNGLGSNTCVQDAFNLAWKIAYVTSNRAGHDLLQTYTAERQPVGVSVVTRANQGMRDHTPIWDALGVALPTIEERMKTFNTLRQPTAEGRARRQALKNAVRATAHEVLALGIEMNQRYNSRAIFTADERQAGRSPPPWPEDDILHHRISTYPGHRLPHVWLNKRTPGERISTIDLAGHGAFCLLTGIGGEDWVRAASEAGKKLNVEIRPYTIGWMCDWEDVYGDWEDKREVEEDGCVLVRPDRFVCWRAMDCPGTGDGSDQACVEKLSQVMRSVLCL